MKEKPEGIRVITRKEHLIMLRNTIMAKFVNDELDCSIWADDIKAMDDLKTDDDVRAEVQKSFDSTQSLMVKRQSAMCWLEKEIAKCKDEKTKK